MMKTKERQDWQADPHQLKTEKIQVWSVSGTMQSAECKQATAARLVSEGRAFIISDQAIGMCD